MLPRRNKTLSADRRRLKRPRIVRLEVNVLSDDVAVVRRVVKALNDPDQRSDARKLLQERFRNPCSKGLKAFLAAAPLEGIDLSRRP
jgi:hypothetical protein